MVCMHTVRRLLEGFIPEHYDLSLDIDLSARLVRGTTTIHGAAQQPGELSVHAGDLSIQSVTIDGKQAAYEQRADDELYITHRHIVPGNHVVVISYTAVISDTLHGLYPCKFQHEGKNHELFVTQFESTHAREVFPCIDEPEAKATFDVCVTTERGRTVLGNMPVSMQHEENGRQVTKFERTPRMSTYLVALVGGHLQRATKHTKRGVEVNVYASIAQSPDSLDFALREAADIIDFFEEYFGVEYPLPKSDHVAIPDFSSGAMENWGLITYREMALLAGPSTSTIESRQYIATVIAHEISHQWFGNLVTMKWWNNLWLNESFASIMEYVAPHALHPEWDIWFNFLTQDVISALRRDALDGVQPVQVEIHHPDEIESVFDGAIVYAKGARLLRMLEVYIGEEAFRAGLKQYFQTYAYSNTTAEDLWASFGEASGKDVAGLMNTWISQPGYPVVSATKHEAGVELSQTQFFIGPHEDSHRIWPIPLGIAGSATKIMASKTQMITDYETPLFLNHDSSAHFVTLYSADLRAAILDAIRDGTLDPARRLSFIHEQILLSRAGLLAPAELIDLLDRYRGETLEPVWRMIFTCIGELKKYVLDNPAAEQKLRQLVSDVCRPLYEQLGWDAHNNEPDNELQLRPDIIGSMVYARDQSVIDEALARSANAPNDQLDPQLRGVLLSVRARYGEPGTVARMFTDYQVCHEADLRQDIENALTSIKNSDEIDSLIAALTDTTKIRSQDTLYWYIHLLSNRFARAKTWRWSRDNWSWIENQFGSDKSYDYFPRFAGQLLMTRQELTEYREFYTPKLASVALRRAINIGLGDLEGRVKLIERESLHVAARLLQL